MNFQLPKSVLHISSQFTIPKVYASRSSNARVFPQKRIKKKSEKTQEPTLEQVFFTKQFAEDNEFETTMSAESMLEYKARKQIQIQMIERKMRLKTIERRFFLSKMPPEPNLLTWDMKEHLFYLHSTDPEEWTPFSLSQAFPISVEGVGVLLKSQNKTLTAKEKQQHDLQVLENWRKLTKGKIGNMALLRKAVERRMSESNVTLPAPTIGTSDEVISMLQDLKFTPTDDLFVDEIGAQSKVPEKKGVILKSSFKSIITQYNEQKQRGEKNSEEKAIQIQKCRDISEVLPNIYPTLTDSKSRVVSIRVNQDYKAQEPRPSSLKHFNKPVTLEEYTHLKSLDKKRS